MNLEKAKKELIKRYMYLYENASFILAPYMHEQSEEEFKNQVEKNLIEYKDRIIKKPLIYLNINSLDNINALFEEFLLSDKPMEESVLYQDIESKRNDKNYLEQVKKGLKLLEKENAHAKLEMFKSKLSLWEILAKVSYYIEGQSADLNNKEKKLYILDQYYKLLRYKNDGKIYTSGRKLNLHDVSSLIVSIVENKPFRDNDDIGINNNKFISEIYYAPIYNENNCIFTEKEKQQIYLQYHDELPCDLKINCKLEDECIETMIETRLERPENTEPCGEKFIVKEDEIFINPNDNLYRYYQMCPYCGYLVNIPKEILSEGIKQRIEDRCSKDDKLFRKMFLYSELFSLDKLATKEQKKILKK